MTTATRGAVRRVKNADPTRLSLLVAALSFLVLAVLNRGIWFAGDDFSVVTDRYFMLRDGQWADAIFSAHNEHPYAVHALVHLLLQGLFGLHHPILFAIPVMLSHALVVFCITRFLLRHLESRGIALTAGISLVFLSAGSENLLWIFQFGFVSSIAFGVAHLLVVSDEHTGRSGLVLSTVLGVLAVQSSSAGVVFVAVGAGLLVLDRRWLRVLVVSGAPTVVWGMWWLAYGSDAEHPSATWRQRLELPQFTWRGITESTAGLLHLPGAGTAAFLLVVVGTAWAARRGAAWRIPVALAGAGILFYALTGFGRLNAGVGQASAGRYIYTGAVLIAPLVFTVLDAAASKVRGRALFVGVLAAWLIVAGATSFRDASLTRREIDSQRLRVMSSAAALARERPDLVNLDTLPSPVFEPNITVREILELQRLGLWPKGHVDDNGKIAAALNVSLVLVADDGATPLGRHDTELVNAYAASGDATCAVIAPRLGARLVVAPDGDEPIGISADFPVRIGISLASKMTPFKTAPREFVLDAGQAYLLRGWPADASVVVDLDPGTDYRICGTDLGRPAS